MLNIQQNIRLSSHTTFHIGGPAKHFVEVGDIEEMQEALRYAQKNRLNFFILGGGSNILVSDQGFDGIVIKDRILNYEVRATEDGIEAEIGSGLSLNNVVRMAAADGFIGLEWAAGIPGTLGGAVRGNAGAFGGEIKDCIKSVKVLKISGEEFIIEEYKTETCKFGYRDSIFKQDGKLIIVSATIDLKAGEIEKIQNRTKEIWSERKEKQPIGIHCAGSFFKNPIVENPELIAEFEKETGLKIKNGKLPAGWLIDLAGLRGKNIGEAKVSQENANFIINTFKAKAEDVVILSSFIKQQVRDKFGVQLKEEVQFIGF